MLTSKYNIKFYIQRLQARAPTSHNLIYTVITYIIIFFIELGSAFRVFRFILGSCFRIYRLYIYVSHIIYLCIFGPLNDSVSTEVSLSYHDAGTSE
jgi:hypothetical protein